MRKAVNLRRGHFPGQWLNVDNLAAGYWLMQRCDDKTR
jgi:hypothetical protein